MVVRRLRLYFTLVLILVGFMFAFAVNLESDVLSPNRQADKSLDSVSRNVTLLSHSTSLNSAADWGTALNAVPRSTRVIDLSTANQLVELGDCNGDGERKSSDITAVVLEIFDGDGTDPSNASNGTFPGDEVCDANEDGTISAADITCVVFIIFLGPDGCSSLSVNITSPNNLTVVSSSPISVSGTVRGPFNTLKVNGSLATLTENHGFVAEVPLKEGNNTVTAVAEGASGGVVSASVQITLDTTPPVLVIETPRDGLITSGFEIMVAGAVNDMVKGIVSDADVFVTCNGASAQVENGSFAVFNVLLSPGENSIACESADLAGNVGQSQVVQVTRQQLAGQHIEEVSGNNQTGTINEDLGEPLIVRLVNADRGPVAGRNVSFQVTRGSGSVRSTLVHGRSVDVTTDSTGEASVIFMLGSRAGMGNHRVTASASGFVGEVDFVASADAGLADIIIADSGLNQRGAVGEPSPHPIVAAVFDADGNPLPNIEVTFEVTNGGGDFNGAPSVNIETDADGRAATEFTLGPTPGVGLNRVTATFVGLTGIPAVFVGSAFVPGRPEDTTVSGIVLDNADQPIPGATARVKGTALEAIADDNGLFTITDAPVGTLILQVDGTTSPRSETFPVLEYELVTIAGQDNTIGGPILMPALDTAGGTTCSGAQACVLSMASVPGATLTIASNSVTRNGEAFVGDITFTQVHADNVPMVPPNGSIPAPAWTVQPAGLQFDPPAQITLPNVDGLSPGQRTEIYQFDHDLEDFISVGTATISEDGSLLVSDPGFGITKAGWGCNCPILRPARLLPACNDEAKAIGALQEMLDILAETLPLVESLQNEVEQVDDRYFEMAEIVLLLDGGANLIAKIASKGLVKEVLEEILQWAVQTQIEVELGEVFSLKNRVKLLIAVEVINVQLARVALVPHNAALAKTACAGIAATQEAADLASEFSALAARFYDHFTTADGILSSIAKLNTALGNFKTHIEGLLNDQSNVTHSTRSAESGSAKLAIISPNGSLQKIDVSEEIQMLGAEGQQIISKVEFERVELNITSALLQSLISRLNRLLVISSYRGCSMSALNRSAGISQGGNWRIDGIPTDPRVGAVRTVRVSANCSGLSGRSAFVSISPGQTTIVPLIELSAPVPAVVSLSLASSDIQLSVAGSTTQLTVTGTFSDGTMPDLTTQDNGTFYGTSNPAIATVDAEGLVTAVSSGTAFIAARNDEVLATAQISVILSDDDDFDGLPNDYELTNSLDPNNPADALEDPDNDGLTNLEEFQQGTEPFIADTDGDGLEDGGEVNRGTDPLNPDSDLDGLLDGEEVAFGSNPLSRDSDGDGLPDGIEVDIVGNPFSALPFADNDGDQLTNIDEIGIGTDPTNPDTDNDAIKDGEEVVAGTDGFITDPLDPDTDGDRFADGDEVALGSNPLDPGSVPFDIDNPPLPPLSEPVGPIISIVNISDEGRNPSPVPGEPVGPIISIVNISDEGRDPSPVPGEPVSRIVSIENVSSP